MGIFRKSAYLAVDPRRPIGATLCVLALLAVVGRESRSRSGGQSPPERARGFVEERWGRGPDIELRFRDRQYVAAASFSAWTALAVPGVVLYGLGHDRNRAVGSVGALLILLGAVPLGLFFCAFVRTAAAMVDYYRWDSAGRPASWVISICSQFRESDLLWWVAWVLVLAALMYRILFP